MYERTLESYWFLPFMRHLETYSKQRAQPYVCYKTPLCLVSQQVSSGMGKTGYETLILADVEASTVSFDRTSLSFQMEEISSAIKWYAVM